MWSLPDIRRLNDEAVVKYEQNKKKTEKQLCCRQHCDFCDKKANHALEYYDIFSDFPKGHVFMCKECIDKYGDIPEGNFYCDDCQRLHIENYTWENYVTFDLNTDEALCLNCAFDREIKKDQNWITSSDEVTWSRVRSSKHLIPVKGNHWEKHMEFIGNTEFDSMTGGKLTGFSSCSTIDDGLQDLRKIVNEALTKAERCILILDAGYQFSVSIGVYIERS